MGTMIEKEGALNLLLLKNNEQETRNFEWKNYDEYCTFQYKNVSPKRFSINEK